MSRLPTGGVKLIPTGPFGRNITAVFHTGERLCPVAKQSFAEPSTLPKGVQTLMRLFFYSFVGKFDVSRRNAFQNVTAYNPHFVKSYFHSV